MFRQRRLDAYALLDVFDVRFWGAAQAAQSIKIRPGGSIIFTIGESLGVLLSAS